MTEGHRNNQLIWLVSEDGIKFKMKKEVLLEHSDYFKGLFNSGMKECEQSEIQLSALPTEGLRIFVDWFTDRLCMVDYENIQDALTVGTYLQCSNFISECENSMKKSLSFRSSVNNMRHVKFYFDLAEEFNLTNTLLELYRFLLRNPNEYSKTPEFDSLSIDEIFSYLSHQELNVESECTVFQIALSWYQAQKDKQGKSKVMKAVRFSHMPSDMLASCTEQLESEGIYKECEMLIKNSEQLHENPWLIHEWKNLDTHCNSDLRNPKPCLLAIGGFTKGERSTNKCQLVSIEELTDMLEDGVKPDHLKESCHGRKTNRPEYESGCLTFKAAPKDMKLPEALCEHCLVVVDDVIYVAGGQTRYTQNGRFTTSSVYRYDPRMDQWTKAQSMQTPRSLFCMCEVDGYIYAVGGWLGPNSVTRSVEKYSPRQNTWEFVSSTDIGLHEHAGCTHDGVIYVSGGFKGPYRGHLDKAWCYKPHKNTWHSLAPMRFARSYHVMVSVTNQILVIGGVCYLAEEDSFENVKEVEQYSIKDNQWTTVTFIPQFASCMPATVLDNKVLLLGGHSFSESRDDLYKVQVLHVKDDLYHWSVLGMQTFNDILHFTCTRVMLPQAIVKKFTR